MKLTPLPEYVDLKDLKNGVLQSTMFVRNNQCPAVHDVSTLDRKVLPAGFDLALAHHQAQNLPISVCVDPKGDERTFLSNPIVLSNSKHQTSHDHERKCFLG